jgi:succinylglutamate desuccinylase
MPFDILAPPLRPPPAVHQAPAPVVDAERLLGRISPAPAAPGAPTLVVVAGIHGNEPAGPAAVRRVLAALAEHRTPLAGELVALGGNLPALAAGRRYLERDLNRLWLGDRIGALRRRPASARAGADAEQIERLTELEAIRERAGASPFVLDLHTTSGDGFPFANLADTLRNRRFARAFPVPIVVGLEEALEGTMLDHLESQGWTTLGFEGGQHDDPRSVDACEAAIWIALAASGVLPAGVERRRLEAARESLRRRAADLPAVLEVCHRHAIRPGDEYRMEPGFVNFQPIHRGQLMGRDRHGEVRAPQAGRVLMPLYQQLGDDGYFVVQEFSRFWMAVSALLRTLGFDRRLALLPGIHPVPGREETIAVEPWVLRTSPAAVFRLLGYRRERQGSGTVVLSRRRVERR